MIVETSGWRHLKEKNKLFLSYEYKKCDIPVRKWPNFPKFLKLKMENPISPQRFKKLNYVIQFFFQQTSSYWNMIQWNQYVIVDHLNSFQQNQPKKVDHRAQASLRRQYSRDTDINPAQLQPNFMIRSADDDTFPSFLNPYR